MHKLTVKDFKYFNGDVEIVSEGIKKIVAHVVLETDKIIYHVSRKDSNVILCFNSFEEALKAYNEISESKLGYPFK